MFKFNTVDSTHVLCNLSTYDFEVYGSPHCFEICLLRVDVVKMECEIMDMHRFKGLRQQIIIDSTDSRKFLFFFEDENRERVAQKGYLTNDGKFEFGAEKFEFPHQLPESHAWIFNQSYKLAGKRVGR
jgi:hypothetical protein